MAVFVRIGGDCRQKCFAGIHDVTSYASGRWPQGIGMVGGLRWRSLRASFGRSFRLAPHTLQSSTCRPGIRAMIPSRVMRCPAARPASRVSPLRPPIGSCGVHAGQRPSGLIDQRLQLIDPLCRNRWAGLQRGKKCSGVAAARGLARSRRDNDFGPIREGRTLVKDDRPSGAPRRDRVPGSFARSWAATSLYHRVPSSTTALPSVTPAAAGPTGSASSAACGGGPCARPSAGP